MAILGAGVLGLVSVQPVSAEDSVRMLIANSRQPFPADITGKPLLLDVPQAETQTRPTEAVQALDPVETAALYFYAKERQTERVEAEIKRLQALHPGFVPPKDLYITADTIVPDETDLWALFANDDFTDPSATASGVFDDRLSSQSSRNGTFERWIPTSWVYAR